MTHQRRQTELPLAANDGQEQLEIASHELAGLATRLEREGRRIITLQVRRQDGYTVTIQKGRHAGQQASHH